MLHDLGGGITTVNGMPARWASLTEADSIGLGPYLYRYTRKTASETAPKFVDSRTASIFSCENSG